jgi:hypothetical protein
VIRRLDDVERDAHELILFTSAFAEAGFWQLAQRARVVADDVLWLATDLKTERAVREKA